ADVERRHHAPGDRFAMEESTISAGRLNCVAEGVAKIEKHANTHFPLIQSDHFGLDSDGSRDHFLDRCRVALVNQLAVTLDKAKQRRIADESGFDAFINAGTQLPLREGSQQFDIRDHLLRRIETPHQVLAGLQIYSGLAANGRIDLREQGGRYLDVVDSAHIDSADKTTHVAGDASTEGDEQRGTVSACFRHLSGQPFHLAHALMPLSRGQKEHDRLVGSERSLHAPAPEGPDLRRGEKENELALSTV